jgi:hypothetical protein
MVTRWAALVVLVLSACPLPTNVLYRCGDRACPSDQRCWSDGYCHPAGDGDDPDAGAAGGGAAMGGGGGGGEPAPDGSVDAGPTSDGGEADGGDAGPDAGPCVPLSACPAGALCGAFDAGCGLELDCGRCTAPDECGTVEPNACGLPKLCPHGFCWENPLPQGNTLLGAFALGPRAVWAVGEQGTVLFWNGERSALLDVGTTADLRAVAATSMRDVYVVGDQGTIVHFDGASWVREAAPGPYRLNVVLAVPGGLVFAGANGGYLLKRDAPGRWSEMSFIGGSWTADIVGLVQLATGELFATSHQGVFRLPSTAASSWVLDTSWSGPNRDTLALAASGAQLYAGGKLSGQSYGVLLERVADAGWQQVGEQVPGGFSSIAAGPQGAPWVAGPNGLLWRVERDGGLPLVALSRDAGLRAVTSVDADSVFVAGEFGTMALVSEGGVRELSSGGVVALTAVCGFADARVYGPALESTVYERRPSASGARWDAVQRRAGTTTRWNACFADGPDRVWVMGDERSYLRQSGGVFTVADTPTNADWVGVWAAPTGPWFCANVAADVYKAATSADSPTYASYGPDQPTGMYGVTETDVLVVGATGGVRALGNNWSDAPVPQHGRALRAVHAQRFADGGVLYSVVGTNTAWRRVNGAFVADSIPTGNTLRGTWVAPAGDIWAGGDDAGRAVLWHFMSADAGWLPVDSPTARGLTGLGGYAETGPYLVGQGGAILRRAGLDGG